MLRFFSAYGPWGRPDMALFKFTKGIINKKKIDIYNNGKMYRDFTYIDDIVGGIIKCCMNPAEENPSWNSDVPDNSSSSVPWNIFNIGSASPIKLLDYVTEIENCLGLKAKYNLLPLQPGDVPDTYSDISLLKEKRGYKPDTGIRQGVAKFVDWYREYYADPYCPIVSDDWVGAGDICCHCGGGNRTLQESVSKIRSRF